MMRCVARLPVWVLYVALLAVLGAAPACSQAVEAEPAKAVAPFCHDEAVRHYKLTWSDEFDGTALDAAKWDYRTGPRIWSDQLPENVSVSGGMLHLALKKQESGGRHYTAGGIISKQTFHYGYYEARFKVPAGAGWHTSFWMVNAHPAKDAAGHGVESHQEIDVCENDSVRLTDYGINLHRWPQHKALGHKTVETPNLAEDFHVWGCLFTPAALRFYFDGKHVHSIDLKEHKDMPQTVHNIWLTAIAANLGKTKMVDNSKLPATADFDYVRFFTPPDQGNTVP